MSTTYTMKPLDGVSIIYSSTPDHRHGRYDDTLVLDRRAVATLRWRYRMMRKDGLSPFMARYTLIDLVKIGLLYGGERHTASGTKFVATVTFTTTGGE